MNNQQKNISRILNFLIYAFFVVLIIIAIT